MASRPRSFVPTFEEVKVDQITESRISSVVAMLPTSLQSGPIRFLRRSISLHTLRRGTVMSPSSSPSHLRPRPFSETNAPTLGSDPLATQILTHESIAAHTEPRGRSGQLQPTSRVLYSEPIDDEQVSRAASGVHWKFARQGKTRRCCY